MITWIPTSYRQKTSGSRLDLNVITICERQQMSGESLWAIHDGGCHVLNIDGDWEVEFQPSSRTSDFITRTRFKSADAAMCFFEEWIREHG